MNLHLHPKIMAAFLASLAAMVVAVGNAAIDVYPQWVNIILILVGAVAGYIKSSTPKETA